VHGISLPPGEFGGPWIDRLFTNSLPADAHPYFVEIAGSACRRICAYAATAR
jgi:AmpD protein